MFQTYVKTGILLELEVSCHGGFKHEDGPRSITFRAGFSPEG